MTDHDRVTELIDRWAAKKEVLIKRINHLKKDIHGLEVELEGTHLEGGICEEQLSELEDAADEVAESSIKLQMTLGGLSTITDIIGLKEEEEEDSSE